MPARTEWYVRAGIEFQIRYFYQVTRLCISMPARTEWYVRAGIEFQIRYFYQVARLCISMDRISDSDSEDAGSIPARVTCIMHTLFAV